MIYLLPWAFDNEGGAFKRRQFGKEEIVIASIWQSSGDKKWYSTHIYNSEDGFLYFKEICEKIY